MLSVGDAGQALSAAVSGIGRARVPLLLAEGWRELGRLDQVLEAEACRRGYWLAAPLPQWRQKKVKALVAALTPG
jgi:LysR family glycine cleavage system transcriptional activator